MYGGWHLGRLLVSSYHDGCVVMRVLLSRKERRGRKKREELSGDRRRRELVFDPARGTLESEDGAGAEREGNRQACSRTKRRWASAARTLSRLTDERTDGRIKKASIGQASCMGKESGT